MDDIDDDEENRGRRSLPGKSERVVPDFAERYRCCLEVDRFRRKAGTRSISVSFSPEGRSHEVTL
jgi:hypothetical protein